MLFFKQKTAYEILAYLSSDVCSSHLVISNVDATYDSIRRGTAALNWTIEGTRANGAPWRLSRGDLVASQSDVAIDAANAVAFELDTLDLNPFERVRVTNVRVEGSRSEEHTSELQSRQYLVCRLLLEKKKIPNSRAH